MGKLEGKISIVTGASSGIGKGIAKLFAGEGSKVVLAARNQERLNALKDELAPHSSAVIAVKTDVSMEDEVLNLFKRTDREFGRLDILVNCAGVWHNEGSIEQARLDIWRETLDTNLTGPFLCSREALKLMRAQRSGRIINIGSISAQMPRPNTVSYNCSKMGLVALTKTIALEGRDFGVSACCVHPGNVSTEMEPIPGEPAMATEDLMNIILSIASLPPCVSVLETIVLPLTQPYLGRG